MNIFLLFVYTTENKTMTVPTTVKVIPFELPEIIGTSDQVLQTNGSGACVWTTPVVIDDYPLGYITGMIITHVFHLPQSNQSQKQIEIGHARSQDNLKNIDVTTPIVLMLENSGVNGLDTGVEAADTWYYIYVIVDDSDVLPVAGIFSVNSTSPTLPAGYDRFRFIGAARNNEISSLYIDDMISTDSVNRRVVMGEPPGFATNLYLGPGLLTWTSIDASEFYPIHADQIILSVVGRGDGVTSNFTEFRASGSTLTTTATRAYHGNLFTTSHFMSMELPAGQSIEHQSNVAIGQLFISQLGYNLYVGV